MAGKENQDTNSQPPETPGLRVLARIKVEKGSVSLEPITGGVPIVNLATGERALPTETTTNNASDDKRKSE